MAGLGKLSFEELCRSWGIALTGGIASGKSTIARKLKARGLPVVDADFVSRLVVAKGSEGLVEVVEAFGADILTAQGEMDRVKMRDIIFASAEKRRALEYIIHRRLAVSTADLLDREGVTRHPRLWFYEASLIFERQRQADFQQVWVAYCPPSVQLQRLMARDHIDALRAEAILQAQMSPEEKKQKAHTVIDTDCSDSELEARIDRALAQLPSSLYRQTENT